MEPINVFDYEALAQARMVPGAWDYYQSGSDDEVTLRANRAAFEGIRLRPRVLVDVSACDLRTAVLGTPVDLPIMIAPSAFHGLAHPEGECATARGAGKAGAVLIVSTSSTRSIEDIAAAASGPLWFQLYVFDRGGAERLVARATAAGCQALVLTVDAPRWGHKERSIRSGFRVPAKANFTAGEASKDTIPLSWEVVSWLKSLTSLPLILKGIFTAEDALLAVEYGADAIVVSNHGGRQLDGVAASIEVLPEVVEAVAERCEVYVDGGIRRGTDVLKALALGARAVLIGRPALWGLAVGGAEGVAHVLELLRSELELAMALSGRTSLAGIDRSLVTRGCGSGRESW